MNSEVEAQRIEHAENRREIELLQVVICVAVGGGFIGNLFAHNPKHAYIDGRVGRRPYGRKDIEKMRLTLVEMAEAQGLDPSCLPPMPRFHGCGVL